MTTQTQTNAIISRPDESSAILAKARELAQRLKFMIVNGQKLADPEVYALAQYGAANDLNPFAQECYYMPGVGAVPGIAGWRKKAQEQLNWEAASQGELGAHYWGEDRDATTGEAYHDPKAGDIAVVYTLHDWLSNKRWRRDFFATMKEARDAGYERDEAKEMADVMVGPEPVWIGLGIVYGVENFGSKDKMPRRERALKRAEKMALRKRFPRVNLPEPVGVDAETVDVEFRDTVMDEPENTETSAEKESRIIGELTGFSSPAQTAAAKPAVQVPIDTSNDAGSNSANSNEVSRQTSPNSASAPGNTQKMSLEMAGTVKSKEGEFYKDMPMDQLAFRHKTLSKIPKGERTPEQQFKIDALEVLIQHKTQEVSHV